MMGNNSNKFGKDKVETILGLGAHVRKVSGILQDIVVVNFIFGPVADQFLQSWNEFYNELDLTFHLFEKRRA